MLITLCIYSVLFIDLVKNYDVLLPPTIARKKRESERKVPVRKRTAPVDMRLSRSRISVGADAKQLLAAQQVAQNPSLVKTAKSPELPPLPPPVLAASVSVSPTQGPTTPVTQLPPPPPPPLIAEKLKTPPPPPILPPPPVTNVDQGLPARPSFKEPPPEDDHLPPRPSFKEPPPEVDELAPPVTQPADLLTKELEVPIALTPPLPPPTPSIIAAMPQKRFSGSNTPSPSKVTSRSPSPPDGDVVLGTGKSNISRSGSAQSTTSAGLRGPRLTRGPRPPSGNVQSLVQNLNRTSVSGSQPSSANPSANQRINRLSGSPVRRPSSVVGRSAAFSRRTMASDAEDDVVDRK
jgi:hypothetical protein